MATYKKHSSENQPLLETGTHEDNEIITTTQKNRGPYPGTNTINRCAAKYVRYDCIDGKTNGKIALIAMHSKTSSSNVDCTMIRIPVCNKFVLTNCVKFQTKA